MLCVLSKCYTICIRARSFARSLPDMAIRLFRRSHARSFARSFVHSFTRLFDQLLLLTPQLICSSNAPFSGKSPLFPCCSLFRAIHKRTHNNQVRPCCVIVLVHFVPSTHMFLAHATLTDRTILQSQAPEPISNSEAKRRQAGLVHR